MDCYNLSFVCLNLDERLDCFLCVGGAVDAEHFRLLSGGKPSRKCGIMSSGNHLFFSEDGLRMLVTNDLDLSNAR